MDINIIMQVDAVPGIWLGTGPSQTADDAVHWSRQPSHDFDNQAANLSSNEDSRVFRHTLTSTS